MKRDMDLTRKILFEIEECNDPYGPNSSLKIEGYSDTVVSYHVKLLYEAGLIDASNVCTKGPNGYKWFAGPLTFSGHEFLDQARNENIWNNAKKTILDKGVPLTIETLKIVFQAIIKNQLS